MNTQELINELRNHLPPKVDYAKLVGAESFSYGCCYVWEDPEPYIIENAVNTIESQCLEIERLESQNNSFKQENSKLQEFLHLAIDDIKKPSVCDCCEYDCQGDAVCIDNGYMNFSWRCKSI